MKKHPEIKSMLSALLYLLIVMALWVVVAYVCFPKA